MKKLESVLKVGGSLGRGTGLPALCREISRLGASHSLLVVPGGGNFADQVREADRRFHLEASEAHFMALLAMDQYGYVLHHLISGSCLESSLATACESAAAGRVAVLLPSSLIMKEDPLPHSWLVTSDSIAAWVAAWARCNRLILLKDVDGLSDAGGLIEDMTLQQMKQHAGGVDEYLSTVLSSVLIETWIISGLRPERLSELMETAHTTGTRIR